MNSIKAHIVFGSVMLILTSNGCIEPFAAKTEFFEDSIVVDALLTDELKQHRVLISRSFRFEEDAPTNVSNASVSIVDSQNTRVNFVETESGVYESEIAFAAEQGQSYTLEITTSDGKVYKSSKVQTPVKVPIEEVKAVRRLNGLGEEGVSILLDNNYESSLEPTFFRFEYDETYKIIAPKWDPFEFEVIYYEPCTAREYEVGIKTKTEEQRVCYGTAKSNRLIQTSTTSVNNNKVDDFEVRFINRTNYILSHRYRIEVRQYSQNQDAHAYYQGLGDFSSSENIFSQVQPGPLESNIFLASNNELGMGYFEVASVSNKVLYFNYADLFENEPLPPYAISCLEPGSPALYSEGYHCLDGVCDGNCDSPLIDAILAEQVTFAAENENYNGSGLGPYFTWPVACGDCTVLGSNIKPEFWIEE